MMGEPGLPRGFAVRLNPSVRRYDRGRSLVGGSPTTAIHFSGAVAHLVDGPLVQVRGVQSRALVDRLLSLGMADPVLESLKAFEAETVTVVVPVRDRPLQLKMLLRSIPSGMRVLVVDDGSVDPHFIEAVAHEHGAEFVQHRTNRGPAAARNTGLRRVRSPFVAFVDSDVVLEPDTIAILLRHLRDPAVALVAPRILGGHPNGSETWITRYEDSRASLDLGSKPGLVRPRAPVPWVPSACLVGRVAALGGGFDPELRVAEDVDLVWRLVEEGWRIRYEPGAVARHEHHAGLGEWWSRKCYYGNGAALLQARHGSNVAPAVFSPWTAAAVGALLAQRRWSVPVALLVSLAASNRIAKKVGWSSEAGRISFRLTAFGVTAALSQSSALMLRDWWPIALVGSMLSRRVRRAVISAAVIDAMLEFRRTNSGLDLARFAAARRLDDLAYGTGVWLGAMRAKSIRCLLPDIRNGGGPRGRV